MGMGIPLPTASFGWGWIFPSNPAPLTEGGMGSRHRTSRFESAPKGYRRLSVMNKIKKIAKKAMSYNKLWETINTHETTVKCNYMDDVLEFEQFKDALDHYKENNPKEYAKLVKLYEQMHEIEPYQCKFWLM